MYSEEMFSEEMSSEESSATLLTPSLFTSKMILSGTYHIPLIFSAAPLIMLNPLAGTDCMSYIQNN